MKKIHIQIVTLAIIIIMGVDLIDTTVMNNILPKMAETFDTTPVHLKMGISIYMIVMGLFLPISSWIAEKVGYKYTLIFAASGFGFFSMMSGLAMTDTQLFIYRGMQGLFAAFSAPVASLAYLKLSENMLEGTASLSNYTLTMAIGGQIIGGVLASLSADSWRLAFLMQVPFILFAIFILFKYYPKEDLTKSNKKFDFIGLTLIGLSLSFLFILSEIALKDVPIWIKITLATLICIFISLYAFAYKIIRNPVLDFSVFKSVNFKIPFLSNFLCRLSTYWVFFAWPILLYKISGLNMIYISGMSVFLMVGTIFSKKLTKKLVYDYGYKPCMMIGLLLIATTLCTSIITDIHYNYPVFCLIAMAYGFALGMYQTSSNAITYSIVNKDKLDTVNTLKNSGNMISSAFALTIFTLFYDFYHMLGNKDDWDKVFYNAYYCVVMTAAIFQVLLAIWIWFRMENIKTVK